VGPEALDEESARAYVLEFCQLEGRRCPRCEGEKAYRLKDGRSRCATCQFTFHALTGRWANRAKLSCANWLSCVRLFVNDTTVHEAARSMGVAYNTAFKAFRAIRLSIFYHAPLGAPWPDGLFNPSTSPDPEAAPPEPVRHLVFGMTLRDGQAEVVPVLTMTTEEALTTSRTKVASGGIVFTGKHNEFDHLIFCETSKTLAPHVRDFTRGRVYLRDDPFWTFAVDRINHHHRISPRWFPYYLKELVLRYNRREQDMYPEVVRCLCCFIPKLHR
jgi:transposase